MLRYRADNPYKKLLKLRFAMAMISILCVLMLIVTVAKNSPAEAVIFLGLPYAEATNETQTASKNLIVNVIGNSNKNEETDYKSALKVAKHTDSPTILIYHTHTLEAYTPTASNQYIEKGGRWRTTDNSKNIVLVGELLAEALRKMGFNVIHDTTNHEPPELSSAYERSEETMRKYKELYPSITMFIDLHRDAAGDEAENDFIVINGKEAAKIMFVVGNGKGATGSGFSEKPNFEYNLAFADAIREELLRIHPDFVRPTRIKSGRYNQHISNQCLLIEIGHNMNTLEQAVNAVPYLANAIYEVCGGEG
ncbi:MAG TPA: stage II sporulation protein P [Clostridiales bacterium]|nr:stage II sporulation protein P [Clostridiales bacterium]